MTEKNVFRIAVLSDLHVLKSKDDNTTNDGSWLAEDLPDIELINPFTALEKMVESLKLKADLILCCGDIADKASFSGQKYVWDKIQKLKDTLNVTYVLSTVGNHDLDSRTYFDPKGALQTLEPIFPGINENYSNQFWAKNYAFLVDDDENVRVLNINSSAFHGYGNSNKDIPEYLRGRISDYTLDNIQIDLNNQKVYDINIAFFHHHPFKWEGRNETDYSEMINGNKLIKMLSNPKYGRWLIIHGHKHWPNITKAEGASSSPIVLSAGSFASRRIQDNEPNQFYIIELHKNSTTRYGLSIAGNVRAWNWFQGTAWQVAHLKKETIGIPDGAGFGNSEDIVNLTNEIEQYVSKYVETEPFCKWEDINVKFEKLKFILPYDLDALLMLLEAKNIVADFDKYGKPTSLSKDRSLND